MSKCNYNIDWLDNVVYLADAANFNNGMVDLTAYEVFTNDLSVEDTSELNGRYRFSHNVTFSVNGYLLNNEKNGFVIDDSDDGQGGGEWFSDGWVVSGYTCVGYDKHYLELGRQCWGSICGETHCKFDGRQKVGALVERDSSYCGYQGGNGSGGGGGDSDYDSDSGGNGSGGGSGTRSLMSSNVLGSSNDSGSIFSIVGKKFYVIVKKKNTDAYFLLNPMIPCVPKYTFTLGENECRTEFTLETVSNFPMLPVDKPNIIQFTRNCEYFLGGIENIDFYRYKYTKLRDNRLYMSRLEQLNKPSIVDSDFYKDKAIKGSVFTETFDGENIRHSISVSYIKDKDDRINSDTLHFEPYSIYERYIEKSDRTNKYVALIKSKRGNYYGVGFGNGLTPNYTVNGDSDGAALTANLTFEDLSDKTLSQSYIEGYNGVSVITDYKDVYVHPEGAYEECDSDGKAKGLLMARFDAYGNAYEGYKVKRGYQQYFENDFKIIGTFTGDETYDSDNCAEYNGSTGGTLPSSIALPLSGGCKNYTFSASCDWYVTTDFEEPITVIPSSGYAGEMYTLMVCNAMRRWVVCGYTCVGYDKYALEIEQISNDGGVNWYNTGESRRGSLIETDSEDCGYVPPVSCVVNSISCSPTSATLSDSVTSVTTTVNINATGDGCGRRWSARVEDDSVPSGYVTIFGNSGDSLEVKQEQTVTIKSLDDDSKRTTFEVSRGSSAGYLIFKSVSNSTYSFSNAVQYSLDSGSTWTSLSASASTPTVSAGDTIYWKASITPSTVGGVGTFSSTGTFEAYGNALSLSNNTFSAYQFRNLFSGCTGLTSAQNLELPTSVTPYCYSSMFTNCTSLTGTPTLPAYTLEDWCYHSMFADCTSLVSAPSLPATALAAQCYEGMFRGCSSLRNAPSLSVTTLAYSCYKSMFQDCTSLTSAPALPATTLTESCYMAMFLGCTSLTTAPTLSASTLVENCYMQMFQSSAVNNVTCLATDISAHDCTYWWLYAASSTGTFTKKSTMSGWSRDASGIPANWTVNDR